MTSLLLIPLMILAFYFLLIRPQRKRQQEQQKLLNALEPGSRVLTHTGIFGTLISIGDKQAVLEISPGQHVTVLRQSISRTVGPNDEDTPEDPSAEYDLDDRTDTLAAQSEPTGAYSSTPADPQHTEIPDAGADHGSDVPAGGIRDVTTSYFARPEEPAEADPPLSSTMPTADRSEYADSADRAGADHATPEDQRANRDS